MVANYNDENDLKKISIDELPAEHRKLNNANILSFEKDTKNENLCKYFLDALLNKPVPKLTYPASEDNISKMVSKL